MIQIDVYSDVVCPWCYIGEKMLQAALSGRPGLSVKRRWRPFQLQPGIPADGLPWREFATSKFGGEENMRAAFAQVRTAGAPEARFDFDRVASAPNTVDAHRLILYAGKRGLQWQLADALYEAYFAGGANLNDHEELARIAAGVGLDADEARRFLAQKEAEDEVWAAQQEAGRLGVTGVPFYVFDNRYALSGAQPTEVFERALDAAQGEPAV